MPRESVSTAVTVAGEAELIDAELRLNLRFAVNPAGAANWATCVPDTITPSTVAAATTVSAPVVVARIGETKVVAEPSLAVATLATLKEPRPACVEKRTMALGTTLPRRSRTTARTPAGAAAVAVELPVKVSSTEGDSRTRSTLRVAWRSRPDSVTLARSTSAPLFWGLAGRTVTLATPLLFVTAEDAPNWVSPLTPSKRTICPGWGWPAASSSVAVSVAGGLLEARSAASGCSAS